MSMFHNLYVNYRNGVVHLQFLKDGKRISSGTGFICQGKLITNNHVIFLSGADSVLLRTPIHSRTDPQEGITLPYATFIGRLISGDPEQNFDYAIMNVPELLAIEHHDFKIAKNPASFGDEYAIFGYPLDHANLTVHRAMVSSIYEKAGTVILQLDASVNNGNSGGPLLEKSTGHVVGIVTRKNDGLTKAFEEMEKLIKAQIELVTNEGLGTYTQPNTKYSPTDNAISNLTHLQELCRQIKRSANTGIGYAFSIEHIANDGNLWD